MRPIMSYSVLSAQAFSLGVSAHYVPRGASEVIPSPMSTEIDSLGQVPPSGIMMSLRSTSGVKCHHGRTGIESRTWYWQKQAFTSLPGLLLLS